MISFLFGVVFGAAALVVLSARFERVREAVEESYEWLSERIDG